MTGFDVDLTHWTEYRDTRTIDANLQYDPATGYNKATGSNAVRPNPAYGPVYVFTSDGKRDQTAISSSVTRRLKHRVQTGLTYTLMLEMKDNGGIGYGSSPANNPFNYLDGEWATSQDFQRHTVRGWGLVQLPWGLSASASYFYGSGKRFPNSIATSLYGKTGTNRLNLSGSGGAQPSITIPAAATALFGTPSQNTGTAYVPREGQLAVRLSF